VDYIECQDDAALAAFDRLARSEGILAALETSHAVAKAIDIAAGMSPKQHLVICLSGRGDKDAMELARLRGQSWE
jgi:tryptophan synthase beta chain